ncbi:Ig-like domain-containing protein [Polaribacter sejongensis]|uniref:Ig-like domain-containing protein n=1 Tax=Polaribacter sejongensis TaxID=985043 RepID=UPI0035A65592
MIPPKYNTYKILIFFLLFYQFTSAQTAPVAKDDSYTTTSNTVLRIETPGLLSNDTDIDDDDLEVTEFTLDSITYACRRHSQLNRWNNYYKCKW